MGFFEIFNIITTVIAAASAISAVTPTKKDDKVLGKVKKVTDVFALNVLNAKNKE